MQKEMYRKIYDTLRMLALFAMGIVILYFIFVKTFAYAASSNRDDEESYGEDRMYKDSRGNYQEYTSFERDRAPEWVQERQWDAKNDCYPSE